METKKYYTGFELKRLYQIDKTLLESILHKISSQDLYRYWKMMEGYDWDIFLGCTISNHKFYLNN